MIRLLAYLFYIIEGMMLFGIVEAIKTVMSIGFIFSSSVLLLSQDGKTRHGGRIRMNVFFEYLSILVVSAVFVGAAFSLMWDISFALYCFPLFLVAIELHYNSIFVTHFLALFVTNFQHGSEFSLSEFFSHDRVLFAKNYLRGFLVKLTSMACEYAVVMACFYSFNMPVAVLFPVFYYSWYRMAVTLFFTGIQSFVEEVTDRKGMHRAMHQMLRHCGFDETSQASRMLVSTVSALVFAYWHVKSLSSVYNNIYAGLNFFDKFLAGISYSVIHESELQDHKAKCADEKIKNPSYEGIGVTSSMHSLNNTWVDWVQDTHILDKVIDHAEMSIPSILVMKSIGSNVIKLSVYFATKTPYITLVDSASTKASQLVSDGVDVVSSIGDPKKAESEGFVPSLMRYTGLSSF